MEPNRRRNWCIMTRIIFLALLCQNNYFLNSVEGRRFHHKKIKHKSAKSHVAPSPSPSVPSEPVVVIHDPPSPPPPNITNSINDNNCSISSPSSYVPSIPIIVTHDPPPNSNNNDNNSSVSSPSAPFVHVVVTYSPAPPPYSNNNDNNSSVSSPSAPFAPVVVTYSPAPPPYSNNNDNNSSVFSPSAPFAPVVVTYSPAPPPYSNNNDNNSSVSSPSAPFAPVVVTYSPAPPPHSNNNDNNSSVSSPSAPFAPVVVTYSPAPPPYSNNNDNNSSVSSPSAPFAPVVVTYSPAPPPYSNNNDNNSSVSSPSAPFAHVVVTYSPTPPPYSNNNDNNSSVSSPSAPFAPVVVTYSPAPPPHSNNNDNNSSVSSPSAPFALVVTYNPAPPPYNSNNDNSNSSISSPIPSIPSDPIVIHDPPPPTNNNNYIDNNSSISSPSPSVPTSPVVVTYNPPPPYNKQNDKNNSSISSPSPIVPSDPVIVIHDPPPSNSNDDNSSNANCIFNVLSFGAIGDGCSNDTAAFRKAWKAACAVEYATVLVPSDYTFLITSTIFSGPCKPGLVFQVDGVIMPPDGPESWPKLDSPKQWIIFYRLDQMTFTGNGMIQGNGEKWWELPCKPHRGPNNSTLPGPCDSPALIQFFTSSNLTVSGLRIINSPKFHMKFNECEGVLIEKLSISSPKLSPNTDGIHFDNTNNVGIYNSIISNGDDCISIGTGCSNIEIEDVTCRLGHGISIGSLGQLNSHAYVSNINVQNIMIKDSDNGLRIKTWQGGTGCVKQISFENIQMENVRNCIIVDQYYCLSKGCRNQTSAVFLTEVSYKNVRGTYDVRSPPIHFACSDTVPCTNITMSEVELFPYTGELIDDPFCWNTYGTEETLTIPPIDCFLDGQPQEIGEVSSCGCSRQGKTNKL